MTTALRDALLVRLVRKLRLENPDSDTLALLEDELEDAEAEILLVLNVDELEERFFSKLVELAAVYYRQDEATTGVKSRSYSEGDVSQSESFLTPEEYRRQAQSILDSVRRYRQVRIP